MPPYEDLSAAAKGLAEHPQDHGWRTIYRVFDHALRHSAPHLGALLSDCYSIRRTSATHLLTLLGIALKLELPSAFALLNEDTSYDYRVAQLEALLPQYGKRLRRILLTRQNSFTCARRFLVTQVLLGARFGQGEYEGGVRFADLGTGLGILPRQLNAPRLYNRFGPDLIWPGGLAAFKSFTLNSAFAMDRGPFPDIDWVHACYGDSSYYSRLYDELLVTLADPDVANSSVQFGDIDLLDADAVAAFLEQNQVNVVNMTYVLYEFPAHQRRGVLQTILSHLQPPGFVILAEPTGELHRPGCVVELYEGNNERPLTLCLISDGHFTGHVIPLEGYEAFISRYPIAYQP
jgi:hypothetical protein